MKKPHALAKVAERFNNFSLKKKFAAVAGAAGAVLLAGEMLLMPAIMAPRLEHRLDDAIRANDAQKVEQVLHSHYASAMWGGTFGDKWDNKQKEFLAGRMADATRGHDYAALDAILKNDTAPYSEGGTRSDDLFIFLSHDVTYENSAWRRATLGEALKNADTKALEIYYAHGFKVDQAEDDLGLLLTSKTLIAHYVKNPEQISLSPGGDRYGYSYDRSSQTVLSYLILKGAPVKSVMFAIDQGADVQGAKDHDTYMNQPLYAAIARSADAEAKQASLQILDALLKRGASADAVVSGYSGYNYAEETALYTSLRQGSPESTKMLVQAGADVDNVLRKLIRDNVDPAKLKGWDASVKAAASNDTRDVLALADQQRAMLEKLQKKAAGPK
jgi:hypothetical protein